MQISHDNPQMAFVFGDVLIFSLTVPSALRRSNDSYRRRGFVLDVRPQLGSPSRRSQAPCRLLIAARGRPLSFPSVPPWCCALFQFPWESDCSCWTLTLRYCKFVSCLRWIESSKSQYLTWIFPLKVQTFNLIYKLCNAISSRSCQTNTLISVIATQ